MNSIEETIALVETAGARFRFRGEEVRVWYPSEQLREKLVKEVSFLRAHRDEVAAFLKERAVIPLMPPGVQLIEWNLNEPPIAVEVCAVVTDPVKFARSTVEQLRVALENPGRLVGWTVPQLIDRLAQVGVKVVLELEEHR
jgi:hypothetical protein